MTRVGADEAGKGPVIGPMIAAAVRCDLDALPDGIDDSKRLSASRRESIDSRIRSNPAIDIGIGVVPVAEIDDPETDMNTLTVRGQVRAIRAVAVDGDAVIVDAGDVSADRFADRVTAGLAAADRATDVTAEHGADESYPIVGAASIVAKVERDRRIAALASEYESFGDLASGYPSDPNTRSFLETYVRERGDVPDCARRSWSTCSDLLAAADQSSLEEF
ncbi:MAG: ribonuclease HII [Halobacteriota archaeon]